MFFDIDEIPESGYDFKLALDKDNLKINGRDCSLSGPATVQGRLIKIEKDVYLKGRITTALSVVCTRCLGLFEHPVECEVSARFVPKSKSGDLEDDLELHTSDIDTEYYSENKINIFNPVHDQILLAVPMVRLCRKDCKGLCPTCGKNLNEGSCDCDQDDSIDPRLSILKSLKDKIK
ncbi:MAG: DUF177 domain-containing protein [Nitrospinales bacterium]